MKCERIDLRSGPVEWGRPVVTIGNFDGVHLGHQRIVRECRQRAAARSELAVVLTFDPHPVKVLNPKADFRCLKTTEQRLRALELLGVDAVALVRFDRALQNTSADRFVSHFLAHVVVASEVLVGPAFRFGSRRAGDFQRLTDLGRVHDFVAHSLHPVRRGGEPVSSTRIRAAVDAGDVREAAHLLGRPFRVFGTVQRGAGRGRGLGFATANLATDNECLPCPGVYGTRITALGRAYRGATFIGQASTFGDRVRTFETHMPDWPGDDLYDAILGCEFICRIRDQRKFPSVDALRAAIESDLSQVRRRVRWR